MSEKKRASVTAPSNPESAADVAARHEVMLLMRDHPQLWPRLNVLTLHMPIDWPQVLATLAALTTMEALTTVVNIALAAAA